MKKNIICWISRFQPHQIKVILCGFILNWGRDNTQDQFTVKTFNHCFMSLFFLIKEFSMEHLYWALLLVICLGAPFSVFTQMLKLTPTSKYWQGFYFIVNFVFRYLQEKCMANSNFLWVGIELFSFLHGCQCIFTW